MRLRRLSTRRHSRSISRLIKNTIRLFHILGETIWRLFPILAQLPCTTSQGKLDYYQQKVNVQVSDELLNNGRLTKLGKFKRISEILGMKGEELTHPPQ